MNKPKHLKRSACWMTLLFVAVSVLRAAEWHPAPAPLATPWTSLVDPQRPLPEHPRPDFQRNSWQSLNGLWDYALEPVAFQARQGFIAQASMTSGTPPADYAGKILVPFAIDAPLSGVMHVLRPQERLWYRRDLEVPAAWQGQRLLLHIEASDWETSVYVNGQRLGQHRGGYDPFQFDITEAIRSGKNTLHLCVWDGTEQNGQPLGKQIMPENKQGFRYQPTGGIWQSVWLEAVPATRIDSWKVVPRLDGFDFTARLSRPSRGNILRVSLPGQPPLGFPCGDSDLVSGSVPITNPKLWSPDSPHLYTLALELMRNGKVADSVASYVGLRTIARNPSGRFLLNGQPAPFMFGPLDQGYWPDGILTPPDDAAIRFDLEYLKSIGCNMVRVHIKTHPARWYYHADRLGLLVWQDMICTPKYGQTVDQTVAENWRREFREVIDDFHNHPSIILWIVFNEAWGQHDTKQNTAWAAAADPSRLITSASGWSDHGAGDVLDVHNYSTFPTAPVADGFGHHRALVFGEVGGHNLLLNGHLWVPNQPPLKPQPLELADRRLNYASVDDMAAKYPFYFRNLRHFVARQGYQAIVYTQISDVEHECNGWLTYDRKISKLPAESFRRIHTSLSVPLHYRDLAGKGEWLGGPVAPTPTAATDPVAPWAQPGTPLSEFKPVVLPHTGRPLSITTPAATAFGLRWTFTLAAKPAHAVLELRATHADSFAPPPTEKPDGVSAQVRATVSVVTYLDGRLHRRNRVSELVGQGEAVTFLELTEAEIATLTPGAHTLAIEIENPAATVTFDARLLTYTEGKP
jgi:hypothetical protein